MRPWLNTCEWQTHLLRQTHQYLPWCCFEMCSSSHMLQRRNSTMTEMKDNKESHTPKHFKNLFSFTVPRTAQTTKGFPSKEISSASALGAVPAHAQQRICSSISLHTTLCHTRRRWQGGLCQDEPSNHYRKVGRRKHTLVTLTLFLGLHCCWLAEAAVAFWVAEEELGDRLFWTPNTVKKSIAMRVIWVLQCRWHSG